MANDHPSSGWYKNENGELCFEGKCFGLRSKPDGDFEIAFDDACDIAEAKEAQRALTKAALDGKVSLATRRRSR